jgi:hypothetical protein
MKYNFIRGSLQTHSAVRDVFVVLLFGEVVVGGLQVGRRLVPVEDEIFKLWREFSLVLCLVAVARRTKNVKRAAHENRHFWSQQLVHVESLRDLVGYYLVCLSPNLVQFLVELKYFSKFLSLWIGSLKAKKPDRRPLFPFYRSS